MITLYSKTNCSPCNHVEYLLNRWFTTGSFQVLKFNDDESLLKELSKFNVSSVPTIITEDNIVLNGVSIYEYLKSFRSI